VVVDVAVCKAGELLGRWLNQFVARIEPDEQDERIGRSLADRYVSVRPDLDGVSFLSAALSSMDAASIDRVLTAIAAVADPGDIRTMQQRRADALVDVLLGRIRNGCHTRWDGTDDNGVEGGDIEEDGSEDDDFDDERRDGEMAAEGWDTPSDQEPTPDDPGADHNAVPDADADADADPDADPDVDADGDPDVGAGPVDDVDLEADGAVDGDHDDHRGDGDHDDDAEKSEARPRCGCGCGCR